jgi:uncharacterized protein
MEEQTKKNSLWLAALFLALGLVVSALAGTYGIMRIKERVNTVSVTGSAKKQIKSDFMVWHSSFSRQAEKLPDSYQAIEADLKIVKDYLQKNGVDEKEIILSPIQTYPNNLILPNGQWTNQIESYRLTQGIEIRSSEVDKITQIFRDSTELINEGIQFDSHPPQYFYTKIADLKIDMLALATQDARERAQTMATHAGAKIKSLHVAKMGVFQITPLYSNEISDYGINDTHSMEKEIMAVVNAVFLSK